MDPSQDLRPLIEKALGAHQAGRLSEALALYRQAIEHAPDNPDALALAGIASCQAGRTDDGIGLLQRSVAIRPESLDAQYNLAHALETAGRFEDAAEAYRKALEIEPGTVDAHVNLGNVLRKTARPDEAIGHYRQALTVKPDHAAAALNLAGALAEREKPADAAAVLETALRLSPNDENVFYALIRLRLAHGDPRAALAACDTCLSANPRHTRALALKPYVLNDLGETAAAGHLLDVDRLARTTRAGGAHGYENLDSFNRALKRHVLEHPSLEYEPEQKSTRFGSQTAHLQHETTGPVARLQKLIQAAVIEYRDSIAPDPSHPFFARIPERFSLNIWATVLTRPGHQRPHFHPAGWLSGVYYVALPDVIGQPDAGNAGWLEFGRSHGFEFKTQPPVRAVCPEEGLIVLFPSYFYHCTIPTDDGTNGTNETDGGDPRISIAFDAVPQD